jgi:hypothetical protein
MDESGLQLYDLFDDKEPRKSRTTDEVRLTSISRKSAVIDSTGLFDLHIGGHERSNPWLKPATMMFTVQCNAG